MTRLLLKMKLPLTGVANAVRSVARSQHMIYVRSPKRLIRFDDSPRTTHHDVIVLFDRTIRHLSNAHGYDHR
jgi:hypothetical protein